MLWKPIVLLLEKFFLFLRVKCYKIWSKEVKCRGVESLVGEEPDELFEETLGSRNKRPLLCFFMVMLCRCNREQLSLVFPVTSFNKQIPYTWTLHSSC